MVAAAVVAGAAVSAVGSMAAGGAQSSAIGKASGAQAAAAAQARKDLLKAAKSANEYIDPYAKGGGAAYDELLAQMGLSEDKDNPNFGALTKTFSPEDYKLDPGYTPMVNSLEELQATPGYQFQLNQGLQSVNNSAAAQGSLLSGRQLQAVNDYAQGVASQGYQSAWDRAQAAYANAFSRFNTNQTNQYSRLQSMANNGQTAATQKGNNDLTAASAIAGVGMNNGANQAQLAMAQGQNTANMYTGIGNAINSGIGAYGSTKQAGWW